MKINQNFCNCMVAKNVIMLQKNLLKIKLKITNETAEYVEKSAPNNGYYNVQPAETLPSNAITTTTTNIWIAKIDNQKAKVFNLGVAKS
jgi:hypothetical protein